jgi:hypothetical protein
MVKPAATNMTITLQQSGESGTTVKPLVIGEQMVVHTNAADTPILPHQPVALEQDQTPAQAQPLSLERMAGLSLDRLSGDATRSDFSNSQIDLFQRRYKITQDE